MLQAVDLAEQILEIADDSSGDCVKQIGPDGRAIMVVDHENIAGACLRIKALERQAARMALKKYGNYSLALITRCPKGGK
jgi:Bacteriophage Sf6, terminase small subunit-like